MAVFTDLSDEDRNEIAAAYAIGPLTSVIGIADGDSETTYLFRSPQGEFIVTIFENGAEPFDLERAFRTMETLAAAGIPCPRTLRTADGKATIRVSGKLVAVVSYVEGAPSAFANADKCADLGRRVAEIHQTLRRSSRHAPGRLPHGPIHGALSRDNVFFVNDTVSGIINFRLRHDDVLIAELASVLVAWTMIEDGGLDGPRVRAILAGYGSIRRLERSEWQALPAFVLAAAATQLATQAKDVDVPGRTGRAYLSAQTLFSVELAMRRAS
jgi:homoserine kinase type II